MKVGLKRCKMKLLQFKLQEVWVRPQFCDQPEGKRVIGITGFLENKRDDGGYYYQEQRHASCKGYRQEESWIIMGCSRWWHSYNSNITEEVYVKQPSSGLEDPAIQNKVYRVVRTLWPASMHPKCWIEEISVGTGIVDDIIFDLTKSSLVMDLKNLMQKGIQMSSMDPPPLTLIISGKDEEGEDVDVHTYRSMIGCLMYLTASRPDIMFAVCLCARFQVTPKVSHLHAVKRIFRYLKHQPKLGLWYPKDSPFHLEAFSDSDYAGDNHDRRSTSGGCQYLGRRLVSWQCKKQTIVAISSTEAEYVAAASCCAQVLWMQNQLLDYGFNFMNTEIHIDNESTICIVKNPVFHSKTKHIQIRHHFIRDCYEQRLINVVKVHTDDNVADLLTKGFDLARFNFLVVTIGMMNP
ncbi:hypothetical protein Tco_1134143 [Tanacetum coccineum]